MLSIHQKKFVSRITLLRTYNSKPSTKTRDPKAHGEPKHLSTPDMGKHISAENQGFQVSVH